MILDEAMEISLAAHGALLPIVSARPNPQVWYTGSAVDREIHDHGLVFARVRERGLAGDDPSLAFFEWSADAELDEADDIAEDEDAWADANPGLGIRISTTHVASEQRSMDSRMFAVERLGVGAWPRLGVQQGQGLEYATWSALTDLASQITGGLCFSYDVRPDRSSAAIGVAGWRDDELVHTEIVDRRTGTGWVASRLAELQERHGTGLPIICDQASPAASLVPALEQLGLQVETVGAREHAQACGALFDTVEQAGIRHLGTQELTAAVKGAVRRELGDAWAWSRKSSAVDISPLVAITLAAWGLTTMAGSWDGPLIEVFG